MTSGQVYLSKKLRILCGINIDNTECGHTRSKIMHEGLRNNLSGWYTMENNGSVLV
jgi:hypothetical protein